MKSRTRNLLIPALLAVFGVFGAACEREAGVQTAANLPRGHYAPNTDQAADATFIRFTDDGEGEGLLETAIVTYEGKGGEEVELISAVHVADASYYADLEKQFGRYDSLLYEMVKPKGAKPPAPGRRSLGESSSIVSKFQRFMRDTLELDFQLDAIDYRAKNFVHADLDIETYQQLTSERGESIVQLMFKLAMSSHLSQKDGKSKSDPLIGMKMLAAFWMPDSARALKYLLAKELQHMEEIMAGLGAGPDGEGSVLLIGRNKQLVRVLRDRLKMGDKKIGVFFGGAHLSDVEKRIFAEIGLRRTGVRWVKAWEIRRKPEKQGAKK